MVDVCKIVVYQQIVTGNQWFSVGWITEFFFYFFIFGGGGGQGGPALSLKLGAGDE